MKNNHPKYPESDLPMKIVFEERLSIPDFIMWYKESHALTDKILLDKGAILFKGVGIDSAAAFEELISGIVPSSLDYVDGNSPRTRLSSKIYTSTEYDARESITLHNELSYSSRWPSRLFFNCQIPAQAGGETPIADSRRILQQMNASLVEEISRKRIRYIRNLHGGQGIGPSWQYTFETTDPAAVTKFCHESNTECEWKDDGSLRLIQYSDGIIMHGKTGERVWFNQIDQFHPSQLNKEVYETLTMLYEDEMDLPMYVTFGDGTRIPEDMIQEVRKTCDGLAVPTKWEKGDLLMLDNVLCCHGRSPYVGERKVLVSMC